MSETPYDAIVPKSGGVPIQASVHFTGPGGRS
jgi:hypothetical protein